MVKREDFPRGAVVAAVSKSAGATPTSLVAAGSATITATEVRGGEMSPPPPAKVGDGLGCIAGGVQNTLRSLRR